MRKDSTLVSQRQIKVPFHGADLYVVEHDGQPYTAMRPIVEGMGVSWQSQHEKLAANSDRWGVRMILMPSKGGSQEMLCLPLRKLPGWLMSMQPSRVKDESVRERVVRYQNECDDALWQYWNDGIAINPRIAYSVNQSDVLTGGEQDVLRRAVEGAVKHLPKEKRGAAIIKMWSKLKSHFKVPYREIPRSEFTEALSIVQRTAAEWEVVEERPLPSGIQFAIPEHGRYLVVSSEAGAYVYNVNGFQLVARDTAARMKLELLALSEELASLKTRLRVYGAEDDPAVLKPVAFGMRLI